MNKLKYSLYTKIFLHKAFAFTFCFLFLFNYAEASNSVGSIDSTSSNFKYARVCQDISCSTFGNINFKPTLVTGVIPIVINDTNITGHAWGDQIGWINMNPTGLMGANILKVNPTTGVVTGKAYANGGSWINFSPTGAGVTLVDNGAGSNFSGYAWVSGLYGGWLKFDCTLAATCVKTDWRIVSMRSTTTPPIVIVPAGGGVGGAIIPGTPNAVSSNIPNIIPKVKTVNSKEDKYIVELTSQKEEDKPENKNTNEPAVEYPRDVPSFPNPENNNIEPSTDNKYREVFPFNSPAYTENDCSFCIVIRRDIQKTSDEKGDINIVVYRKILKYGFVPKAVELPVSIKTLNPELPEVDATSLVLTMGAAFVIRRYVIMLIIRKLFIGV